MKTEEGQDKDKYDLKNNNSWMDEIEDYKKWKEKRRKNLKDLVVCFRAEKLNILFSVLPQTIPHSFLFCCAYDPVVQRPVNTPIFTGLGYSAGQNDYLPFFF